MIKATFDDTSFLIPGDIQARAEKELMGMAGDGLKSTVLVAPHHGSNSSSTSLFLDTVKPEMVAISAGWKNPFNLPHPFVLARYRLRGCRIFRTDLNGSIQFTTDGRSIKVSPFVASHRSSRSRP